MITVRTVNSRQKKGLNRAVDTTFLSERDAAVESGLSKVRQENVLLVIYSLYLQGCNLMECPYQICNSMS